MNEKTIIYIAGEGRSGSTLLDIILGSHKMAFSTGELVNLPQKGIINKEFCSCGKSVPKCGTWLNIIKDWDEKRILEIEQYIQLQRKLISNKKIISSYRSLKKPSEKVSNFLEDTYQLYNIIFNITNSNVVIDSSKNPNIIPILRKVGFDVMVVHLTRRFGDVLNSYKKSAKKNLAAGIEHDLTPQKTSYILASWVIKNLLTAIHSRGTGYKKVQYEEIVTNPADLISKLAVNDVEFQKKLKGRGPFFPNHLVAGNRIRMRDEVYIANKPMDTSYHRLNKTEKLLARCIDFFY